MLAKLKWRRIGAVGYCAFFVALASVGAQTAVPNTPGQDELLHFDVATIKPVDPKGGGRFGPRITPDGKVTVGAASVKMLVGIAFDVDEWQVTGGPEWGGSTRYDIVGVPPDPARTPSTQNRTHPTEAERQMLQSLLTERFGFKFHRIVKTGPVFFLTRSSGELQLKEPKDKDRRPAASLMIRGDVADGEAFGINTTMANLARSLSPDLGRPVLDRTGLAGSYDFHVDPFDPGNQDVIAAAIGAMQHLGLKLTAGRGPIETIVIDSVMPPTEN
jgi:uncharacterized protein (TIGR03435 family)